jgi:hypothetical protein
VYPRLFAATLILKIPKHLTLLSSSIGKMPPDCA